MDSDAAAMKNVDELAADLGVAWRAIETSKPDDGILSSEKLRFWTKILSDQAGVADQLGDHDLGEVLLDSMMLILKAATIVHSRERKGLPMSVAEPG